MMVVMMVMAVKMMVMVVMMVESRMGAVMVEVVMVLISEIFVGGGSGVEMLLVVRY